MTIRSMLELAGVAHLPKARRLIEHLELVEARKNPTLNPKTNVTQVLADYLANTNGQIGPVRNAFVNFTDIQKFGINPQADTPDPIGIYAYPIDYVLDTVDDVRGLPGAGGRKYFNLFQVRGNFLVLSEVTSADAQMIFKKLSQIISAASGQSLDQASALLDKIATKVNGNTPGALVWRTINRAANQLVGKLGSRAIVAAANMYRKLGYDGVIDTQNIIGYQPVQIVVFSTANAYNVETNTNRTTDIYIAQQHRDSIEIPNGKSIPLSKLHDIVEHEFHNEFFADDDGDDWDDELPFSMTIYLIDEYIQHTVAGRWPELEREIARAKYPRSMIGLAMQYWMLMKETKIPAIEQLIQRGLAIEDPDVRDYFESCARQYAQAVYNGNWSVLDKFGIANNHD